MKKPDRFDRLVKDCMEKDGGLWSDNVAALLRREHKAIYRDILKLVTFYRDAAIENHHASWAPLEALRQEIQQRRRR